MSDEHWDGRGTPWEHDPGPPRNRSWLRLFAETPNYRGIGVAFGGRELFRWHFGPMFYRGRLGDGQVKVLVVGQEGAQDESLSHRAFTGGTGARMQHFLSHLGIVRSYLFLNTFVYPIFGQYVGQLPTLAQHPSSPIARHRGELFDYVVERNDVQLAVAVGKAAQESLATWVETHGGTADPGRLHLADASVISPGLRIVGVRHPGGATDATATAAIVKSFRDAINQVHRWLADDAGWLPVDAGGERRPAAAFAYESAPIPFRDLPYGAAWRLGRGGTSSNRRDGQRAIQLFSAKGKYNNTGHSLAYGADPAGSPDGYSAPPGDVAWEPPRALPREFDGGPGVTFERLLQGGLAGFGWPDWTALGLRAAPSLGTGPIYRGRLSRPSILVLADQESHDDVFTMRAASGDAGQRLQAFLTAAGLTRRYGILRVLPVDTLGETASRVRAAVDSAAVRNLYAEVVRRSRPHAVLLAGPLARRLGVHVVPAGTPVVEMKARRESGADTSWRAALTELSGLTYPQDIASPSFDYHGEREQIPRQDLPFGTLRWQGSSGDRAQRPRRDGAASFDYYKITMPAWAAALGPPPLSSGEAAAVEELDGG
jgi:uracil-DNA glycosylase